MENSLRTLFVKQHLDLLGPRTSFKFETGIELELLKAFQGKVSLYELLLFFKADVLVTPTRVAAPWLKTLMDKPGYIQEMESTTTNIVDITQVDLTEYDLVITHDPIIPEIEKLKERFPSTVFAYILAEHSSWQMHEFGVNYDLFLDHTLNSVQDVVRLPQSINFLFPRVPNKLNEMFSFKKESIFIDYRSVGHFISGGNNNVALDYDKAQDFLNKLNFPLPLEPLSKTSLQPYMFNTLKENDSIQYYSKLSRSKYFVTIANRVGQAAFDAASAGALVIGTDKSELHSRLCHDAALMNGEFSVEDVALKVKQLEKDPVIYQKALKYQENFISLHCIEHPKKIFEQAWKLKTS